MTKAAHIRIRVPGEMAQALRALYAEQGYTSLSHLVEALVAAYILNLSPGTLDRIMTTTADTARAHARQVLATVKGAS